MLGVITWVAGERGRWFRQADLAFGTDLARRAAVAIDDAHLHTQVRDVAFQLQHAVLRSSLPDMPGWQVAVRYLPAGRTEVGGDFYDVVMTCAGSGSMATSLGTAERICAMSGAAETPRPITSPTKYDLSSLVTLVYAVADPAHDEVHVINAGHPPPRCSCTQEAGPMTSPRMAR